MKRPKPKKPNEVRSDDVATLYVGSDRYAMLVVHVSPSGKTLQVRDPMWRNDVPSQIFRWSEKRGAYVCGRTEYLEVGYAETYLDPHF